MDTAALSQRLVDALWKAASPPSFLPLIEGIRDVLVEAGIPVGRLQLPLARMLGFRHPTLALLIITWSDEQGFARAHTVTHDEMEAMGYPGPKGTPYEGPIETGRAVWFDLTRSTGGYPVLDEVRDQGFVEYVAMGLPMAEHTRFQPLSIASREPFPADVLDRLNQLQPLLAMAVYAAYRTSQAVRLAEAYIGKASGPRVLAGEIRRGSTRRVVAGIVFCDIRGFTALSEQLGAQGVVKVVNAVFARVGEEATARGGEILKFIGDAMLLVYPVEDGDPALVARAIVDTARRSLQRIEADDLGVGIGFGAHIGEVVQGNIGTPERLDFTVLGPAVNLASRLEGLCKPLGASAVFSEAIATHVPSLQPAGAHALKGIEAPVPVWRL